MPAYAWITAVALVAFAVFIALGRRWWRVKWLLDWLLVLSVPRWWYSWRRAAHVIETGEREPVVAPEYGSMVLAEEYGYTRMDAEGWLPAPAVDPEPWRAQMTAELSPEALEEVAEAGSVTSSRGAIPGAYRLLATDPGPGDAAVEPPASSGPDQAPAGPSPWLARQLAITYAWSDWMQEKARIFA